MSWDLFAVRLPDGVRSVSDIPDDFAPEPIGPRADVIEAVLAVAPTADFSDPTWGRVDEPGFSIEVNISKDPADWFAFHVRGGDTAIGVVADVLDRLGIDAFDPQSDSGIFDRENAVASLRAWREYRDRAVGDS